MATNQNEYVLESEEEISRLSNQHDVIKDEMGSLVLAPLDLSKPLRILDSGTADGGCICGWLVLTGADCAAKADATISRHLDP
jgi:hypothetical protein